MSTVDRGSRPPTGAITHTRHYKHSGKNSNYYSIN